MDCDLSAGFRARSPPRRSVGNSGIIQCSHQPRYSTRARQHKRLAAEPKTRFCRAVICVDWSPLRALAPGAVGVPLLECAVHFCLYSGWREMAARPSGSLRRRAIGEDSGNWRRYDWPRFASVIPTRHRQGLRPHHPCRRLSPTGHLAPKSQFALKVQRRRAHRTSGRPSTTLAWLR